MSAKDTVDGFQYLPLFALCLSLKWKDLAREPYLYRRELEKK